MRRKWIACRVFVSSTFDDMRAERELLIKQVFPALRAQAEAAGLLVSPIDLRWGVQTETPAARSRVLFRCLQAVDACRPFVVGFIGARRGWVPTRAEIDDETFVRFPRLGQWVDAGLSLTELELLHAVCPLDGRPVDGGPAALVYLRRDGTGTLPAGLRAAFAVQGIEPHAELSKAPARTLVIRRYGKSDPPLKGETGHVHGLAERLAADLRRWFGLHHPETSSLEGFGAYDDRVRALLVEAALPLPGVSAQLDRHADEAGSLVVVTGERGVGKSTALASWVTQRMTRGGPPPLVRFIGSSPPPPHLDGLLASLCDELEQRLLQPATQTSGRQLMSRWGIAWNCAEPGTLLVLDALDRVPFRPDTLQWLSAPLTARASVVLSLDADSPSGSQLLEALTSVPGSSSVRLVGFDSPVERRSLIEHRLGLSLKELDPRSLDRLLAHPLGGHPLYVSVVLAELVLHGQHDSVDATLQQLLQGDLATAVESLLQRLQSDVPDWGGLPADGVRLVLGALAHSPSGLSTPDLLRLVGGGTAGDVESFLHQLAPFLQRRPFAHAYSSSLFAELVRRHVPQPPTAVTGWPALLASLLGEAPASGAGGLEEARAAASRRALDLPRHLAAGAAFDALAKHLTNAREVASRIALAGVSALLADLDECIAAPRRADLPEPLQRRLVATRDLVAGSASTLTAPSDDWQNVAPIARQLLLTAGLLGLDELAADYGACIGDAPRASVRWCRHSGDRRDELRLPPIWAKLVLSVDARWMLVHDGGLFGARQNDDRCWLWNLEERREVAVFAPPGDRVTCAVFETSEPPPRWIAMGTARGQLMQFHFASGMPLATIDTGCENVTMLSTDGDGLWCCVGEQDVLYCTWGNGVQHRFHCPGVTAVHAWPGRPGAAIAAGRKGEIWSVGAGIAPPRLWGACLRGPAARMQADPAGERAWVLVDGWGIAELHLATEGIEFPYDEYRPLNDLALDAEAGVLVAANGVGELSVFDIGTRERRTVKCVQNAAVAVVVCPAGRAWVAGQPELSNAPLVLADLGARQGGAAPRDALNEGTISSVSLSSDGALAAYSFLGGHVWVHDAVDGRHQFDLEPRQLDRVSCCSFGGDPRLFVVGSLGSLVVIDAQQHQVIAEYGAQGAWGGARFDGVRAIGFASRDEVLYAGDSQGLLVAIELRSGDAIGHAQLASPPTGIVTLQDGQVVVSEESGTVSVFSITLAPIQQWTARHHGAIWSIAASGSIVYTGHRSGRIVRRTPGVDDAGVVWAEHGSEVEALATFDGGRGLASAGRDGHLRLWCTQDGRQLLDLSFADALENLAVSAGGSNVLVSLSRGTLACLDISHSAARGPDKSSESGGA